MYTTNINLPKLRMEAVRLVKYREWEDVWNNIRPHEALGYRTPGEYLEYLKTTNLPTKNIITLQT